MSKTYRRSLLSLLIVILLFPAHALAETQMQSASSGDVAATLSWDEQDGESWTEYSNFYLSIDKSGTNERSSALAIDGCESPFCAPSGFGRSRTQSPLLVRNVDADNGPEVLVTVFLGGAHCCQVLALLDRQDDGSWKQYKYDFKDGFISIAGSGKQTAMETVDARFGYMFGSFAASWLPYRAIAFNTKRFVDVTKRYRGKISKDSNRAWKNARSLCRQGDPYEYAMGSYAGWAAGQYRLGKRGRTLKILRKQKRAGCFRGPGASTFIGRLDRFLLRRVV